MGDEADCDPNHGDGIALPAVCSDCGPGAAGLLDTIGPALDAVQFRSLRMWRQEGPP